MNVGRLKGFDGRALGLLPGFHILKNRSQRDYGAGATAGLLITCGNHCPKASLADGPQMVQNRPPVAGYLHPTVLSLCT